MGGASGWGATQALGSNASGVGHVALATDRDGFVHSVFTSGASDSRDIAYNFFKTMGVFLPAVMRNYP